MKISRGARWSVLLLFSAILAGPFSAAAGGIECETGLFYDDGDAESAILPGPGDFRIVQRFTPPQYPYQVNQVCACLDGASGFSEWSTALVFLDDDGDNGGPGTALGSVPVTISISDAAICEFHTAEVTGDVPVITEGSVYIGWQYDTSAPPAVSHGIDKSNATQEQDVYYSRNGPWTDVRNDFDDIKALVLRVDGGLPCAESVRGILFDDTNTWNRVTALTFNTNCEASSIDGPDSGERYFAHPVVSDSGGLFQAEIQKTLQAPLEEPAIYLYCDPFDPTKPESNLIAMRDGSMSESSVGLYASDNLTLAPNSRYWVVVSAQNAGSTGFYDLCIAEPFRTDQSCTIVDGHLGVFSPHYDRAFSSFRDFGCSGVPTNDSAQDNMPYRSIPFKAGNYGFLDVNVQREATTIADTTLALYCGSFDPENPGMSMIAYNDNGPEGLLSAFEPSTGVTVSPNNTYYLVLSTLQGDDQDGGDYQVCFTGDVTVYPETPSCLAGQVGQRPHMPFESWSAFFSDTFFSSGIAEHVNGLDAPIRTVTWWGYVSRSGGVACDSTPTQFGLSIHSGTATAVDTQLFEQTVTATASGTGIFYFVGDTRLELLEYRVDLTGTPDVSEAWIRIYESGDSECNFAWVDSPDGDDRHGAGDHTLDTFTIFTTSDYSICVATGDGPSHIADQDGDRTLSLSELLRVIQFYNADAFGCALDTEDGFDPANPDKSCTPHDADYDTQDWRISLGELLRLVQFYNLGGYYACVTGEDGFCAGE